ncbi:MAG: hypothetical protein BWY43_00633 [candidate division WS2 bacterium ADurb.Bin280]|uniref:Permease n=1 Tax=candidate division WS2 bacterium ADurb.Bin280 TaxID=1852829 RepID=A0A1V5SCC3_9BACT|nr:MAG: hypothetical protein BWY43_00633 [candidate division WS2 bacterium ADurb.Bin280]
MSKMQNSSGEGRLKDLLKKSLLNSLKKSAISLYSTLPLLLATVLLIALVFTLVPPDLYSPILESGGFVGAFSAGLIGSLLAGSPIISYIVAGELIKNGVSLFIATVFIVAWVTVGVVQIPAEAMILGKRFALVRNVTAFLLTFVIAALTVFLNNLI